MPTLLRKLGLGKYDRESCCSPFRSDTNPSWGVFRHSTGYYFKDLATGDSGDEITFIARLKGWDTDKDFRKIVDFYDQIAKSAPTEPLPAVVPAQQERAKPTFSGHPGTLDQLKRLFQLRGISVPALRLATERGFLFFGAFNNQEVFGIRDSTGNIIELRRLDGVEFPRYGDLPARKSHTIRGSRKDWPVGIVEAKQYPTIMLVEGVPDFLAAFDFIIKEGKVDRASVVTMLTAATNINGDGVTGFSGKQVRIYPHVDKAGIEAAKRWGEQIRSTGAKVDFFRFAEFEGIKDLCELNVKLTADPINSNNEVVP